MPRQVLPGKEYTHWVPKADGPDEDDQLYVFPELKHAEDDDVRWQILDSALFSVLSCMFNDWFDQADWRDEKKAKVLAQRMRGWIMEHAVPDWDLLEEGEDGLKVTEPQLRGTLLGLQYLERIINSEPTGHYVSK